MERSPLDASQGTGNESSGATVTGTHQVAIEAGGATATQAPLLFLTTGAVTHHRVIHVLASVCWCVFSAHQDSCPTWDCLIATASTGLSEEEMQTLARDRAALARVQQRKADLANTAVLQI